MEAKEFENYMGEVLQTGFLALAIAVGRDTELLDVMCEMELPATIKQIASQKSLKERYVKEWLGAMVSGRIVEVDKECRLYHIPKQYRTALKKGDMAWFQMITLFATLKEKIKRCFENSGPPGYDFRSFPEYYIYFNKYRETMADELLDKDIIPELGDVKQILEKGGVFADIGCGPGNMVMGMAKRFPKSTFVGVDYAESALKLARIHAEGQKVTNVTFELVNAERVPEEWTKRFDVVFVYDLIHDTPNPDKILGEIYRVLKDDGIYSMTDIDSSSSHYTNRNSQLFAMFYSISMHSCLPSSLSTPASAGLGACWGVEEIRKTITKAGFKIIREAHFTHQNSRNYICQKILPK